jgi:RHS repeat-associated protein
MSLRRRHAYSASCCTNRALHTGKTNYEPLNASPATVKNQLTGFGYDAAGNMTSNGSATYTYDGQNRLTTTAGVIYAYDGDGKRVKKPNGKLYWTDTGSDPMTETDLAGTPTADYIFFNGKRVARRDLPGGAVHYYFSDHLSSASVITNATGAMPPQEESDYYPYGGEIAITNGDPNQYKFTGKERDTESGLDDFGERYYSSALGRFTSADPQLTDLKRQIDPQQLNMYGYGRNNPLRYTDDNGEEVKEAIHVVTYQVHGATANEALANAKSTSGFKSESGEAMTGNTSAHVQVVNTNVETSVTPGSGMRPCSGTANTGTLCSRLAGSLAVLRPKSR